MLRLWAERLRSRLPATGLSREAVRAWMAAARTRLLPDQVHITLSPDEITLARFAYGRHAQELARTRLNGPGNNDWRPLIVTLAETLHDAAWRQACVHIVLSNHFVRYVRVPWVDDLGGEAERLAYARHCFTQLYGERVGRWTVRLSDDRYGMAQLASAVEPELLDALMTTVRGASLRLASLQPAFMEAFNRCRDSLIADPYWFVHIEPGRACLAHVVGGTWAGVRGMRLGAEWTTDLSIILAREQFMQEGPVHDSKIYVYAPAYTPTLVSGEWLNAHGLRLPAINAAVPVAADSATAETVS